MSGISNSSRVVVVVFMAAMAGAAYSGEDLAWAAYKQQWDEVKRILSATDDGQDLDLNVRVGDHWGSASAIYYASANCQADIVKQLVQAGVDINLKSTWSRRTPVMQAAGLCEDTQTLSEFISAGADLTLTAKFSDTALHFATMYNRVDAVRLLLQAGASKEVQNLARRTPAQEATYYNNHELARFIENFDITATTTIITTPTTTTGFTSDGAIDGFLIGGLVCSAVGYILYLLL